MGALDASFGAILLGLVIGSIIFGLTTLQTHIYFQKFPNDARWVRCLVGFIWILDFLHLILCTHAMYFYLITKFGDQDALLTDIWSLELQTDCEGLMGTLVELFFARRVYKLSGNRYITAVIVVLALIHLILGVYFTEQAFVLKEFSKFGALTWVTCLGLGSAAAADLMIAATMVYSLKKARTGIAQIRTDRIISTLIVYAINTGAVTSLVATICVFCFAFMPTNFVWLGFLWVLSKLYANSLLANLNNRDKLRDRSRQDTGTVILPLSRMKNSIKQQVDSRFATSQQAVSRQGVQVNVLTETKVDTSDAYNPTSSMGRSLSLGRALVIAGPGQNVPPTHSANELDTTESKSISEKNVQQT